MIPAVSFCLERGDPIGLTETLFAKRGDARWLPCFRWPCWSFSPGAVSSRAPKAR